jgi:ribosome-binding protein aMBF1 (putative translation factor)
MIRPRWLGRYTQITAHTPFPSTGIFPTRDEVPASKALNASLKQLGNNIRRERMAQGMSQQQLAELAELNIRNIQRIEAGEIDVLLSTAARIRKALNSEWKSLMPKDW